MTQLTKKQIILETLDYYTKNKRGIQGGNCRYITADGDMCAIGRCMVSPKEEYRGTPQFLRLGHESLELETLLREKYRGHGNTFWSHLQRFHDFSQHWNENSLTEAGKKSLNTLLEQYTDINISDIKINNSLWSKLKTFLKV